MNNIFLNQEERLSNLCIIVNHLTHQYQFRPEIKQTLDLYTQRRDALADQLESNYSQHFNREYNIKLQSKKLKDLLSSLKEC